jgi:hypothetical protein
MYKQPVSPMFYIVIPLLLLFASSAALADDRPVFKSDVALSRVDSQVLDRHGRAITGLQATDFVLTVDGRVVPIRNFASENMPIDVLLLLDVSGSMQPHVQRIASAASEALRVLGEKDRVAVMVFDTSTRVRLPFRSDHSEVTEELNRLLGSERFSRGTHITNALLDAAKYVQREARPEARRAIVIMTDDQTQDQTDEGRVERALTRANAILSFLQAPYEVPTMGGGHRRPGTWGHGGGWPGGIGFPGGRGPVIWGPGGGGPPYGRSDPSHSAATATIAADSGGDTMDVENASALEDTLTRLRQRYALYFYVPEGTNSAEQQTIQVDLSREARLRYRDAETRYRRVLLLAGDSGDNASTTVVTRRQQTTDTNDTSNRPASSPDYPETPKRRRAAVNDTAGPQVNSVGSDTTGQSSGGSNDSSPQPSTPAQPTQTQPSTQAPAPAPQRGGWPRAQQ